MTHKTFQRQKVMSISKRTGSKSIFFQLEKFKKKRTFFYEISILKKSFFHLFLKTVIQFLKVMDFIKVSSYFLFLIYATEKQSKAQNIQYARLPTKNFF